MSVISRGIVVGVVVLWAALASAQTTAVVTHNANLRSTPSIALAPIRLLAPNESLTLITVTPVNGFYHVRTAAGEDGWVYRTLLKIGVLPAAPVAAAVCGPGTE